MPANGRENERPDWKASLMETQMNEYTTGIAALVGFQAFTNIAVATGIFPNTGLPLPFISYGVSSLVSLYIGIGVLLNVGLQQNKLEF